MLPKVGLRRARSRRSRRARCCGRRRSSATCRSARWLYRRRGQQRHARSRSSPRRKPKTRRSRFRRSKWPSSIRKGKLIAGYVADATALSRCRVLVAMVVPPGPLPPSRGGARRERTRRHGRSGDPGRARRPAGPLKLSSLVLGLSRGGDVPAETAVRGRAGGGDVPRDLRRRSRARRSRAWLELAQTADGAPFLIVPLVVEGTSEPDKFKAMGAVPVGSLPAGDLLVRAKVQFGRRARRRT